MCRRIFYIIVNIIVYLTIPYFISFSFFFFFFLLNFSFFFQYFINELQLFSFLFTIEDFFKLLDNWSWIDKQYREGNRNKQVRKKEFYIFIVLGESNDLKIVFFFSLIRRIVHLFRRKRKNKEKDHKREKKNKKEGCNYTLNWFFFLRFSISS